MKLSTRILRFLGVIMWTAVWACAGGITGGEIVGWSVADVTKKLPPPHDATFPMVLIGGLLGSVIGVAIAHITLHVISIKRWLGSLSAPSNHASSKSGE